MNVLKIALISATAILVASCASPGAQEMQMAQERSACAELGIDPGAPAYSQCVANLDATMFEAGPGYPR